MIAIAFSLALAAGTRGAVILGPSAYLCFDRATISGCGSDDSPFANIDFSAGYFHLEDFEDGSLNTPGVTPSAGLVVVGPGTFRDSVDADDGLIDGSGEAGHGYATSSSSVFEFQFDNNVLGAIPTHVGLVWTDVGVATPTENFDDVTFEAFDSVGTSLGSIGPIAVGDGLKTGQTAEDRFFGVIWGGGVSRIMLTSAGSTDWEIDHLQYGVPEPATALLLGSLVSLLVLRRRQSGRGNRH